MTSETGEFWDRRYREEGAIWGEGPSPTAALLATLLPPGAHVLDIGFGYGRDLAYLAERGFRVSGIETSGDGSALASRRLADKGFRAERLYRGVFGETEVPAAAYDAVLNHRMAHLMTSASALATFAANVHRVLRPGGLLALAARSPRDHDPAAMVPVEHQVYEYRSRPGHRIRFWDASSVDLLCSAGFEVLQSQDETEPETLARPVPCHLLLLVVRSFQADPSYVGESRT